MLDFMNVCFNFLTDLFTFDYFLYPIYVMLCCGVLFLILYLIRGRVYG